MTAVHITLGSQSFPVTDARRIAINAADPAHAAVNQLVSIAAICNDATFITNSDKEDLPAEARNVAGDATDSGLLRFAESVASVDKLRGAVNVVSQLAFNSKNKYALKLVKRSSSSVAALPALFETAEGDTEQLLLAKGALLFSCLPAPPPLTHSIRRCSRCPPSPLRLDPPARRFYLPSRFFPPVRHQHSSVAFR